MSKKNTAPLSFESSLAELEALVNRMENGDLTLEESLKSFEQGIALTRNCQKALDEAEQKIQILTRNDVDAKPEAFDNEI